MPKLQLQVRFSHTDLCVARLQVYGLPPERIWVSVFEEDAEAYGVWADSIGVPPQRIQRLGAADNFWESGPTGKNSQVQN